MNSTSAYTCVPFCGNVDNLWKSARPTGLWSWAEWMSLSCLSGWGMGNGVLSEVRTMRGWTIVGKYPCDTLISAIWRVGHNASNDKRTPQTQPPHQGYYGQI